MNNYFVMEYLYRDANNFKSWGQVLLTGDITENYVAEIESFLDSSECFVAEQVGIPALYSQLWDLSNGPTIADHAFHELSKFRPATNSEIEAMDFWGTTISLLDALRSVGQEWDVSLSVHGGYFENIIADV